MTEYSFYTWRKRLQQTGPVRFALVDRSPRRQGECGGGGAGTCVGDRRAAAHQRRRGSCDLADRVGRIAGMIHLPANVRVSVAAEESVWGRSTLCAERPDQP